MSSEHDHLDTDDSLDATLREFFAGTLSGQVGRAEREFRSHLRSEARRGRRQRSLLILAFTGGLAATIAGLWASPLLRTIGADKRSVPQVRMTPGPSSTTPVADVVEHLTKSRTIDEGIVMLQDTPVHVFRRQSVDQINTLDGNDRLTSQETTPSDNLVFVKMTTY